MWDLIVSVPDHCLSFYFMVRTKYISRALRQRLLRQDLLIIINTERAKRARNKTTIFD